MNPPGLSQAPPWAWPSAALGPPSAVRCPVPVSLWPGNDRTPRGSPAHLPTHHDPQAASRGGGGGPCGQERQAHDAVPLHAAELRPQRGAFRRHGLPVVRRGATAGGAVGRRGGWGWRRGRKVGLGPSHVSWLSPVWRPAKEVGGGTFWRRPHAPHPQILTRLIDENLPNGNIGP